MSAAIRNGLPAVLRVFDVSVVLASIPTAAIEAELARRRRVKAAQVPAGGMPKTEWRSRTAEGRAARVKGGVR